ncbi:MAG: hypothetical protein GY820_18245 [Gammaproteobacteria bacterium]|nr:hypothetical protein [Gammaproteobacteria bacterium]
MLDQVHVYIQFSIGKYAYHVFHIAEFINPEFKAIIAQYGINHITAGGTFSNKAYLSERAIRSVRRKLGILRELGYRENLSRLLTMVEYLLNHATNERTGLSPTNTTDEKALHILDTIRRYRFQLNKGRTPKIKFGKGDLVRVSYLPTQKGMFEKSSSRSYGSEVFRIHAVKETRPQMSYILKTLSGNEISIGSFPESRLRRASSDTIQIKQPPSLVKPYQATTIERPMTRSWARMQHK